MKTRPATRRPASADAELYDQDFFAWTQRTAARLRAGQLQAVDLEHLATEIEDMGKRDLKELNSRMQVLLMHLLKWQLQSARRAPSWQATMITQRLEIDAILRQSPSLRAKLASELGYNYAGAVKRAVPETGLDVGEFPPVCPFTLDQILDEHFLPE